MTDRRVVVRFVCASCGRLQIELRVKVAADADKYGPMKTCGWCRGTQFTRHEVRAA